jgi:hypothetical protein
LMKNSFLNQFQIKPSSLITEKEEKEVLTLDGVL